MGQGKDFGRGLVRGGLSHLVGHGGRCGGGSGAPAMKFSSLAANWARVSWGNRRGDRGVYIGPEGY